MPDEAGQEEGRAGFHDETATGEDEAYFRAFVRDADVHGKCHGYADADGGALEGADCGFAAVVDGEGYAAASVGISLVLVSFSLVLFSFFYHLLEGCFAVVVLSSFFDIR